MSSRVAVQDGVEQRVASLHGPDAIAVAIVDCQSLYRAGLHHILAEAEGCDIVGESSNPLDAFKFANHQSPLIMLLSLDVLGSNIELLNSMICAVDDLRVILIVDSVDSELLGRAFRSGAMAVLSRGASADTFINVVRDVSRGRMCVEPEFAPLLLRENVARNPTTSGRQVSLSAMEMKILRRVIDGLSNKEIANAMFLKEKTVRHGMTCILRKLGVRNRVEAAVVARERYRWT